MEKSKIMSTKRIRNIILLLVILFLAYNSVYFKKLDEVKSVAVNTFDARKYAQTFWKDKLTPGLNRAIELSTLLHMLKATPPEAFDKYSHALGIGNIRFFLVKGEGEIIATNENDVSVLIKSDSLQVPVKIITEYVFGNAVRDGSGLIDINEFTNMTDFNGISEELNAIVRQKVLPAFKAGAKKGRRVQFKGAIELNREHLKLEDIEVIPIETKML